MTFVIGYIGYSYPAILALATIQRNDSSDRGYVWEGASLDHELLFSPCEAVLHR